MSLKIKETVNAIVLEQLEKGVVAWRQTWNSIQISGTTGRPYGGMNQLILQIQKMKHQYGSSRRLTFRAINQLGAFVKRGEKASPVLYFKMMDVEDKETKEMKKIPTLKLYRVFNLDQTTITNSSLPEHDLVKAHTAEQIRENFHDKPKVIQHPQPHYNPVTDQIGIPHKNDFITEASFWATLFHEGIHSTGAHKRIGRKEVMDRTVKFGDCDYSREELVAEL
jgi:antirestriction protein ArdC